MTIFDELAGALTGTDGDRPPLLLIHGLTFDRRQWDPLLRELPGRRALALDLPGHGESPRRAGYRAAEVIDLLHRSAVAAGLDAPIVVGHSLGAVLATGYAARFPARGVLNLDQPLLLGPFGEHVRRSAPMLRDDRWRRVWDGLLAGMGVEALPEEGRRLVESCEPRADQLLDHWGEILELPDEVLAARVRDELAAIDAHDIPYRWVTGHEPPAAYRAWFASAAPRAETVLLPGGHFPHLSHPAAIATLLTD
ncbi:pimeloyl-ACP methyl ester carboxylesterase [Catenuloplanes nepalensis]|uniref:Pimeloyl-ACP methyl ester carboxylesterase n=1 Tax=Catenuloplanes nepalensis TaxID=587533 RepID=A0ABT9MX84_9ACTN|nr:alpha/beta fold hydrolase [Catenuloplanes nepalensis]MDP9796049.1 pimeloyl-ACP methyl ester carboxylesterase [Catenuloplanes nepalensis]